MKKNLTKAMAMGMAFAMAGTATAFAEEVCGLPLANAAEDTAEQVPDAEVPWSIYREGLDEAGEAPAGGEFAWGDYLTQSGKVSSVEKADKDGISVVTIDNEQGGLRFALGVMTPVLDRETNSQVLAGDLKEGMEIAVIYDANGPMGMSMPPYLGSVTAVVANADKGFYKVGHFDGELTEAGAGKDSTPLQLNIAEDTLILNTLGTRQRMTAEDVKGQDALVFYDVTTRSIPAQTNPSLVLVLAAAEDEPETGSTEPDGALPEGRDMGPAIVPLRKTAEDMGWKVTWQGKARPVLLEKDGLAVEITIGSESYVVDGGMMMEAQAKAELRDGVLFVSDEVFER